MEDGIDGRYGLRIYLVVEGRTEKAFLGHLRTFLEPRLPGNMPRLSAITVDGSLPTGQELREIVRKLLDDRADHVIALADVYTGTTPPSFSNAREARLRMQEWVGKEPRFHAHAAQYEIEAWLLPYWARIQSLAGHNQANPSRDPESVNHENPPSRRIAEIFRRGNRREYSKTRDLSKILEGQDLSIAVEQCPELKALVNTILAICGGEAIP